MALILQIVVLLVVLVGLITIIMSIKNWHWAQMLLLLSIFFMSLATFYLGLETFRLNRNIRKNIITKEKQLADLQADVRALQRGTISSDPAVMRVFNSEKFAGEVPYDAEVEGRMPSLAVWTTRLQDLARARGKVWRNATPTAIQQTGQVTVTIAPAQLAPAVDPDIADPSAEAPAAAAPAAPQGHGLPVGAIVYAFENGAPNPAAPDQGAQYIGEFKVAQATENAVVLEPVQAITPFIGNRILKSIQTKKTWSLYELMPADNHALFAGLDEAALKALLPASTVNEYIRQGTPAKPDDDEYHRAAFDAAAPEGNQIGPDDAKADPSKVVEWRYDRPLRDYSYLFPDMMRERSVMEADIAELKQQIADLDAAQASAKKLEALRTKERTEVSADLKNMERDLAFIKNLRAKINSQIANGRAQIENLLKQNADGARTLIAEKLAELQEIDRQSPAPAPRSLLNLPN
ncbi:hypothetical protein [Lacipirellula parvula]|uniref:Uncharacterized protein n=1 Tax=Lacipirellula parvula TaxID=2650471 RepID=A0A5K7XIN0_9BACT|nr:hypothetical protein [Lacipirellula parvula]BBO36338.1 hypothetical protein PLANPX_5950 [Lacipirellula parvula]